METLAGDVLRKKISPTRPPWPSFRYSEDAQPDRSPPLPTAHAAPARCRRVDQRQFTCVDCGVLYTRLSDIKRHRSRMHPEGPKDNVEALQLLEAKGLKPAARATGTKRSAPEGSVTQEGGEPPAKKARGAVPSRPPTTKSERKK